ncbi:MAG TPA: hypothetical protein VNK52_11755 [Hyphomicrobiaceae bacterium]|nr:hypothetical protein [Hyphomicrobiaceae bacterium]
MRFLVVGGLAVNAHGYLRLTADIGLVIALDPANIHTAFEALAGIGYRPSVPIRAEEFADAGLRKRWQREKGMQVLNFFSDRRPETSVDLFVHEPFDFAAEYRAALTAELRPGLPVRFVSIPTLIRMKEAAGRAIRTTSSTCAGSSKTGGRYEQPIAASLRSPPCAARIVAPWSRHYGRE